MIHVISGSPGLPDFTYPILFVNLPKFYMLCWLHGVLHPPRSLSPWLQLHNLLTIMLKEW